MTARNHKMQLFDLPRDCLVLVLSYLTVEDVFNLECTSSEFQAVLADEELWLSLASELFRNDVDVLRLVGPRRASSTTHPLPIPGTRGGRSNTISTPDSSGPSPSGSSAHGGRIRNFREAYVVLKRLSELRGLWRVIGEGDGNLISFDWSGESMVGQQLVFVEGSGRPDYATFCSIRPSMDVLRTVTWEGSTVGIWTHDDQDRRDPYTPDRTPVTNAASIDVADVGFGTPRSLSSRDSPLMGASPENSFRQAWGQFMSQNVQQRSKMRRRSSRNRFAQLRHLKRVVMPVASKRHPLAGLWSAEIDEDEFEVISVEYDFRSSAAEIVGTKLSGPGFHEFGATIWRIKAAQHTEWDADEVELFNRFKEFGNVEIREDERDIGLGMEALELDDGEPSGGAPLGYCVGRSSYFSHFDEDRDDDGMWPVRFYVLNSTTAGLFFVDDNEAIVLYRVPKL